MTAMNAKKNILKDMRVREISLVDDGDNPGADVLILKRREILHPTPVLKARFDIASALAGAVFELAAGAAGEPGTQRASTILKGMNMDIEGLAEKLAEIETNLDTVTKANAELTAENARLAGELETVTKARDAALEAAGKVGESEDEVLKSLPEAVRKRIEDAERIAREAQDEVTKARETREQGEYVAKARELKVVDADGVGGLLYRIAKGKTVAEDAAKLEAIIKQAGTINGEGEKLFEAIGKAAGGDAGDDAEAAERELNEATQAIQKAKPGLTHAQAYTEALDANPALYDRITKRRPAAATA
jgi:hypothetical protein